jgi:hypothetical protein
MWRNAWLLVMVSLERRIVSVRVEMDDVQLLVEGTEDRIGDRMIAAKHHRQRAAVEDPAHHGRDVLEGARRVGRMNVDVAYVGDQALRHLLDEIFAPRLGVVVAVAAAIETQGMLA